MSSAGVVSDQQFEEGIDAEADCQPQGTAKRSLSGKRDFKK